MIPKRKYIQEIYLKEIKIIIEKYGIINKIESKLEVN